MVNQTFLKKFTVISKNVLVSAFSKAVGIGSQVIIIAVLSRTISKEEFGLWAILSHFIMMISICDFGIGGGGLRNTLAKHNAIDDSEVLQKKIYFSSFFLMCFIYTALFFIWFFFLKKHLNVFLHITEMQLLEQAHWLSFFIFTIFAKMPFSIYGSGFFSYQEYFLKSIFDIIEQLLLVTAVILVFFLKKNFLVFFISYYSLYLFMGIVGFLFFLKVRRWQWQRSSFADLKKLSESLVINGLFWIQNLVSLFLFSLSPFLISYFGNLELGGEYSLIYRFCCLFIGVHFAIINPIWSSYTEAFYKEKFNLIEVYFIKSLKFTIAFFGLGGAFMLIFYKPIIHLWTGKKLDCMSLVLVSCLWMLLYGIINCFSILLNSINRIRRQIFFLLIGSVLNVSIGALLGRKFGMLGVVVAGIIALIPLLCSNISEVLGIRQRYEIPKKNTHH